MGEERTVRVVHPTVHDYCCSNSRKPQAHGLASTDDALWYEEAGRYVVKTLEPHSKTYSGLQWFQVVFPENVRAIPKFARKAGAEN